MFAECRDVESVAGFYACACVIWLLMEEQQREAASDALKSYKGADSLIYYVPYVAYDCLYIPPHIPSII